MVLVTNHETCGFTNTFSIAMPRDLLKQVLLFVRDSEFSSDELLLLLYCLIHSFFG